MPHAMPNRAAFTLVELLVVIAIVALLSGLLLGGISVVKTGAKQVSCRANIRQLSAAVISYAGDHDGLLPWTNGDVSGLLRGDCLPWFEVIGDRLDDTYTGSGKGRNVYHCPFAPYEIPGLGGNRGGSHYGLNGQLLARWQTRWGSTGWDKQPVVISRTTATTLLIADDCVRISNGSPNFGGAISATILTWGGAPWPVQGATTYGGTTVFTESTTETARPPIVRHGGQVSMSALDGHVQGIARTWNVSQMQAALTP